MRPLTVNFVRLVYSDESTMLQQYPYEKNGIVTMLLPLLMVVLILLIFMPVCLIVSGTTLSDCAMIILCMVPRLARASIGVL